MYNYKMFITSIALIMECSDGKEHGGETENYIERIVREIPCKLSHLSH